MMQKYTDGTEIRYFEAGVDVSDWIDLTQYRLMTDIEILKHESNPHTDYHEWNGSEWLDSHTQAEIADYNRSQLSKLSKRQFALYLYDNNMYDQAIQAIEANPRFKIEYDTVSEIERLSPTVAYMTTLLDLTEEQVDEMWEQALTL